MNGPTQLAWLNYFVAHKKGDMLEGKEGLARFIISLTRKWGWLGWMHVNAVLDSIMNLAYMTLTTEWSPRLNNLNLIIIIFRNDQTNYR